MTLTVKIETRHPVEGPYGSEFPAICNHCRLWWPEVAKPENFVRNFCVLFGKTTPYCKIFKILFRTFSPHHRSLLCWNVVKFFWREIGEIVRYLRDENNFGYFSNCLYCADHAQHLPRAAPNIWLTLFQISSKSVHVRRRYCRTREDRFCPVEYLQYRLFEPIKQKLNGVTDLPPKTHCIVYGRPVKTVAVLTGLLSSCGCCGMWCIPADVDSTAAFNAWQQL